MELRLTKWACTAVRALNGCSIAALRVLVTRGHAAARGVIGATLSAAQQRTCVHRISYWSLVRAFAVEESVVINAGTWFDGCTAPLERYLIAHLVRYFKPSSILEVGTYRGTTTRLLLDNMPPKATLYTIDLPLDNGVSSVNPLTDQHLITHREVGVDVRGHPRLGDVVQVLGNTFDEETWEHIPCNIDFAFIDASHSYEAVRNDTERVRQRLADAGVVVWHDYTEGESEERGVGKYIREQMKVQVDIFVCPGTDLAICIPTTTLLEAEQRVGRFFPAGDFLERCSGGAVPWLHR